MRLDDVRRQVPITDRAAYDAAYREADLAGRVAELVHRVRTAAGLSDAELADRMGVALTDVARAEEGYLSLGLLDFLDRLGRAVGERCELRIGTVVVPLGTGA